MLTTAPAGRTGPHNVAVWRSSHEDHGSPVPHPTDPLLPVPFWPPCLCVLTSQELYPVLSLPLCETLNLAKLSILPFLKDAELFSSPSSWRFCFSAIPGKPVSECQSFLLHEHDVIQIFQGIAVGFSTSFNPPGIMRLFFKSLLKGFYILYYRGVFSCESVCSGSRCTIQTISAGQSAKITKRRRNALFRLCSAFVSSEEEQSPLMVNWKTVSTDGAFESLVLTGSGDSQGTKRVPPLSQSTLIINCYILINWIHVVELGQRAPFII